MELSVARVIDNIAVYRNASSLLAQLKLVSAALQRLQQDSCTLGDGVDVWVNLLETAELEPYRPTILKRFQQWLTPTHSAAYLTHPRYRGRGLTHDQEEEAQRWLSSKDRSFIAPLSWFLIEDEKLPQSMFLAEVVEALAPDAWWRLMEKKAAKKTPLPTGFASLMERIHLLPASSAAVERLFSGFGLVHIRLEIGLEMIKQQNR